MVVVLVFAVGGAVAGIGCISGSSGVAAAAAHVAVGAVVVLVLVLCLWWHCRRLRGWRFYRLCCGGDY